jgi:hypothetical protein
MAAVAKGPGAYKAKGLTLFRALFVPGKHRAGAPVKTREAPWTDAHAWLCRAQHSELSSRLSSLSVRVGVWVNNVRHHADGRGILITPSDPSN